MFDQSVHKRELRRIECVHGVIETQVKRTDGDEATMPNCKLVMVDVSRSKGFRSRLKYHAAWDMADCCGCESNSRRDITELKKTGTLYFRGSQISLFTVRLDNLRYDGSEDKIARWPINEEVT